MGARDELKKFGQRLFARWHREAFTLLCGADTRDEADRSELLHAAGAGDVALASAVAALLVGYLGLAPALAAVVAAIVTKRFFNPVYEEFCRTWSAHVPNSA